MKRMGMMEKFSALGSREVNRALLWDQDLSQFDWQECRVLVVQRVIERGRPEDFCAAFHLYGSIEGFRRIAKEVPYLSPIDMNFVCVYFHLQKEELKCYSLQQSRAQRFNC